MTMPPIRKIFMWLVVIFVLYAILTSPTEAANIGSNIVNILKNGIENIFTFFDSLLGH
ncbi:conserved exported hypothetical protein [Nostocoides japonicum T1-X7]|uniref:Uncharacterized protein n=2 Tax=Nostocoides japonicum TaxID=99481 RepID=A0A077M6P9_9MICO|nr:conserved exported hypothetical protein [Tetrasphaera japonica T1-X7]